jgi:hypothetical protein
VPLGGIIINHTQEFKPDKPVSVFFMYVQP